MRRLKLFRLAKKLFGYSCISLSLLTIINPPSYLDAGDESEAALLPKFFHEEDFAAGDFYYNRQRVFDNTANPNEINSALGNLVGKPSGNLAPGGVLFVRFKVKNPDAARGYKFKVLAEIKNSGGVKSNLYPNEAWDSSRVFWVDKDSVKECFLPLALEDFSDSMAGTDYTVNLTLRVWTDIAEIETDKLLELEEHNRRFKIVTDKPPVILVHGRGGQPENFGELESLLEQKGFAAESFYYPSTNNRTNFGYGNKRIEDCARELNDFLSVYDNADIIAHSMGGLVTRAYRAGLDLEETMRTKEALLARKNKIRKFIMIGTPNFGTNRLHDLGDDILKMQDKYWPGSSPVDPTITEQIGWASYLTWLVNLCDEPEPEEDLVIAGTYDGISHLSYSGNDGVVWVQAADLKEGANIDCVYVNYQHNQLSAGWPNIAEVRAYPGFFDSAESHHTWWVIDDFLKNKLPVQRDLTPVYDKGMIVLGAVDGSEVPVYAVDPEYRSDSSEPPFVKIKDENGSEVKLINSNGYINPIWYKPDLAGGKIYTYRVLYKTQIKEGSFYLPGRRTAFVVLDFTRGSIEVASDISNAPFSIDGPDSNDYTGNTGSNKLWKQTDVPAGTYTITWGDVAGYAKPLSEPQKLVFNNKGLNFQGTYTPLSDIIYQTDFSSDPGWQTNNSARYYWDSLTQAYYTENYTNSGEYAVVPITYNDGSFHLEVDLKAADRSSFQPGDLVFGLFSQDKIGHHFVGNSSEHVAILSGGYYDNVIYLEFKSSTGVNQTTNPAENLLEMNKWHHCAIDYDAVTRRIIFNVTREGNNVFSQVLDVPGGFSRNLMYLGVSMNGSWLNSGRWIKAYIDNVKFSKNPLNHHPNKPLNLSPLNSTIGISLTPVLQASNFSDLDGDSHKFSQWEVRSSSGTYASPVYSGIHNAGSGNLTNLTLSSGALNYSQSYNWHLRYADEHDAWSEWSQETGFTTMVHSESPPHTPIKPSGPDQGYVNVSYDFVSAATDSGADNVRLKFYWGSESESPSQTWSGFVPSGTPVTISHTFSTAGIYNVKVMAEDEHGLISDFWSESHPVTISLINLVPDFVFAPSPNPPSAIIKQGESVSFTTYLKSLGGFNSPVTLSKNYISPWMLDEDINCLFSPAVVMPQDPAAASTFSISTTAAATPGTYTVNIKGTAGSAVKYTSVQLKIDPSPGNGSVSGEVREEETAGLLNGVNVRAGEDFGIGRTRGPDAEYNGSYRLDGLLPGSYGFYAKKAGYGTTVKTGIIVVAGQNNPDQNITLTNNPGWIYGTVKDKDGAALNDVEVVTYVMTPDRWFWIDTRDVTHQESGQDGYYRLSDLGPGNNYVVKVNGFTRDGIDYTLVQQSNVAVQKGQGREVNLVTQPAVKISGWVKDKTTSNPLSAKINYWSDRHQIYAETYTDENGNYTFSNLPPGEARIGISEPPSGYAREAIEREFNTDTFNVNFYLEAEAKLSGEIRDIDSGELISDFLEVDYGSDKQNVWVQAQAYDGRFSFGGLPEGIAHIRVKPPINPTGEGYPWKIKYIYLAAGENKTDFKIFLKKAALVEINLQDNNQPPQSITNTGLFTLSSNGDEDEWYGMVTASDGKEQIRLASGVMQRVYFENEGDASWVGLPQEINISSHLDRPTISLVGYNSASAGYITGNVTSTAPKYPQAAFEVCAFPAGEALNKNTAKYRSPIRFSSFDPSENGGAYSLLLPPNQHYDLYLIVSHYDENDLESVTIRGALPNIPVGTSGSVNPNQNFTYLSEGGTVNGRVTYNSKELLFAHVYLEDLNGRLVGGMADTDNKGEYHLYNVPAGNYKISAWHADYGSSPEFLLQITVEGTIPSLVDIDYNRAPVLEFIGNKQINEGGLLEFSISATDPDNQGLNYSISGLPEGAYFSPEKRIFSWLPNYDQASSYVMRFEASDGQLSDYEDVTITVSNTAVNSASAQAVGIKLKVRVVQ